MGFYGVLPKENLSIQESMIPVYECGSICMQEYHNKLMMYESCTDENQRNLLEAQVYLLQEMSIKDIWTKIKEFFNKIIEAVKKFFKKIKDFFTEAKIKELRKRCDDLEKKLKDKDAALSAANNALDDKDAEIKDRDEKIKNLEKDLKYKDDLNNAIHNTVLDKDKKIHELEEKLNKIVDSYKSNIYIYFEPFDYLEPSSGGFAANINDELKSSSERMDMLFTRHPNEKDESVEKITKDFKEYFRDDEKFKEKYYIIKKEFLAKANTEHGNILTGKHSAGQWKITEYIKEDLEEKVKRNNEKDPEKFLSFLKDRLDRMNSFERSGLSTITTNIGVAAENANKIVDKIFEAMGRKHDEDYEYEDKFEGGSNKPNNYEQMKVSYKYFSNIAMVLRHNLSFLGEIERLNGASYQALKGAVNSYSFAFGLSAINPANQ